MYKCSNCGATMSTPLDRCPACKALLSGVKCQACGHTGAKSEFIGNNNRCPQCNSTVKMPGGSTYSSTPFTRIPSVKSPVVAALLSFFLLGGAGQIYLGQVKKGLVLIFVTLFSFIIIPFVGGLLPSLVGVMDAYGTAKKMASGESVGEWKFNIYWWLAGLIALILVILYVLFLIGTRK